jgi:phosphoribosylformylglycinamidine cyclo-ligase
MQARKGLLDVAVDDAHTTMNQHHQHINDLNAGQLVLSPTRTYAPILKRILDILDKNAQLPDEFDSSQNCTRADVHGIVHCSGGAQTKVLHFLNYGLHVVKDNLFPTPPLFDLIQKQSRTT